MVNGSLFLYTFGRKKVRKVDGYDNDLLLLMLDDDLFLESEDDDDGMGILSAEPDTK